MMLRLLFVIIVNVFIKSIVSLTCKERNQLKSHIELKSYPYYRLRNDGNLFGIISVFEPAAVPEDQGGGQPRPGVLEVTMCPPGPVIGIVEEL